MNKTYYKNCSVNNAFKINYVIFTGKHLYRGLFFNKVTMFTFTFGFTSYSFRSSRLQKLFGKFSKNKRKTLLMEFSFIEVGDWLYTKRTPPEIFPMNFDIGFHKILPVFWKQLQCFSYYTSTSSFKWRVAVSRELMFLESYGNCDVINTVTLLLLRHKAICH